MGTIGSTGGLGMFGMFDPLYLIFFGGAALLSMIAQWLVKAAFQKYSKIGNHRNITGAQAAQQMLAAEGITDVKINRYEGGWLSDHYNPATKTINLSPDVYDQPSLAAVGVACHEAGHALQHAHGYALLKLRSVLVPFYSFGGNFGLWITIIGAMMGYLGLAKLGLAIFSLVFVFQLVTLPVELNASSRSKAALLAHGIVSPGAEAQGVSNMLSAAAFTYVAAAVSTLMTILYYAIRLGLIGGRSRDN